MENTLFGSSSILFNDEIKEEKEDLFDELIEVDDINIVEEQLSKTTSLDESELFDLIDSIYEKGE